MKAAKILFCVVICVKTIMCAYSTPKQENDSLTTTSNRLTKRQADDDLDYEESSEKPFRDPQKPGRINNGVLFAPSGRIHNGILLAPSGHSRHALHPKPFEGYLKSIKNKNDIKDIVETVDIKSKCKHYKPVEDFDFVLMADTWQIAYYISKDKLACFKISIQSTSPLKKKVWTEMYGNFNGSVKWNQCVFEMMGSESNLGDVPQKNYDHRHFLQGSYRDKGVFTNIIIEQHPGKNATLIQQSPDQWLVYKDLLLMRDCDNGEVVVFAKVTLNKQGYTNITEIEEALTNFQEPTNTGVLACNHWNNNKFLTLS